MTYYVVYYEDVLCVERACILQLLGEISTNKGWLLLFKNTKYSAISLWIFIKLIKILYL